MFFLQSTFTSLVHAHAGRTQGQANRCFARLLAAICASVIQSRLNIKAMIDPVLNFNVVVIVLVFIVLMQGCTDRDREIVDIEFEVASVGFSIPSSFLSYSDDYNGGIQDTITINTLYPSMTADVDRRSKNRRVGKGIRILLHSRGTSSKDAWHRASNFLGNKIIGEKEIYGLTKHLTKGSVLFDKYTYSRGGEILMFISCPKRKVPENIIMCVNRYKIINDNIYVSYLFEERLLSDFIAVDSKVEEFILGIKTVSSVE